MADEQSVSGDEETTTPPVETTEPAKEPASQEPTIEEQAKLKLEEDLINLGKAKTEALAELARIRDEKQKAKKSEFQDDVPKIDLSDPSAQAWDKHIRENVQQNVQPVQQEMEQARAEVRDYALQKFLQDKPALAKNPERVRQLMNVYDRLHTASERTVEGVLTDLDMSYGAITYKEREAADYQERLSKAQADEEFSQAAVSKGATGYQANKKAKKILTEEERMIVANMEAAGAPHID